MVVTSAPVPGALRVPLFVQMIVPLRDGRDQVLERYDVQLRKRLKAQRVRYVTRRVTAPKELDLLLDTMLEPYACARNGDDVVPLDRGVLHRVALGSGRLDVLSLEGKDVGCMLGYPRTLPDANVWVLWRLGYPREIFETKRLGDVNAMAVWADLERVMSEGRYDYYDMGSCVAQPDDGLVQWKRRRGGRPSAFHTHEWLSVLLPKRGRAQLLWDSPLWAAEAGHLSLNMGLPADQGDAQLLERSRFLKFDGLKRVRLHAERQPGVETLRELERQFGGAELALCA